MKIQYEPGDPVYPVGGYGGEVWTIMHVRQNGVAVKNDYGETMFLGKHQIEPHPSNFPCPNWIPTTKEAK